MKTSEMAPLTEKAFLDFIDGLKNTLDIINGPLGAKSEREKAEGIRHVLRLSSLAMEQYIEKNRADQPQFTRWMDSGRKLLGDNPYTVYDVAMLDREMSYVVKGQFNKATYVGFVIYGEKENGDRCIVSHLEDEDLQLNDDGSFELTLSKTRPSSCKNWLELGEYTSEIMIRQYFIDNDRSDEAKYSISCIDHPIVDRTVNDADLAKSINKAQDYINDILNAEVTIASLSSETTPVLLRDGENFENDEGVETIDYKWVAKAMPTPAITYTGFWINDLADDEAIVIEGKAPEARYWSLQFISRWMESPDYINNEVFFTPLNTKLNDDGTYRIVVAHKNPGVDNWLNTTGIRFGTIALRALLSKHPEIVMDSKRVKIAELK
jgi:hypothetical protein